MDLLVQSITVNVLHSDEVGAISLTNLVDVGDVRMIKRGSRARLLIEAPHSLLIRGNLGRQKLQRDFAMQPRVFGQINLAHPTLANL